MFKQITGHGHISLNGVKHYKFHIEDSCFVEPIIIKSGYADNFEFVLKLIRVYKKQNLNILPNLVRYYLSLYNSSISIIELITSIHPKYIDLADKSIRFRECYVPLLKVRMPSFFASRPRPTPKYSIDGMDPSIVQLINGNGDVIH